MKLKGVIKMNEIVTLISNVGFPIACCIVLFMQNSKFNDALNANTEALRALSERIERIEKND